MEYCNKMFKLYNKISPNENIVGWYSSYPNLDPIMTTLHSVLSGKYYRTAETPFIYMSVDLSLQLKNKLTITVPSHKQHI